MPTKKKIAVAGAGIYGATIAIRLAERGHAVTLFDPLGIACATSAINQYRIHSGYHYPRSPETILETLEARSEFQQTFAPAVVRNSHHFYAIPREGSKTPPALFEEVMARYKIPFAPAQPDWMNFSFIDKCYAVDEHIYDPNILKELLTSKIDALNIAFVQKIFEPAMRADYDAVVFATYGLGPSRGIFKSAKYQVAEKILIELPPQLRGVSLVIVDGPFTAFDPYGSSEKSLFGSAKLTNHWTSTDPSEPIPENFARRLNRPNWEPYEQTRFDAMRAEATLGVPASAEAKYLGSRFTIRVVENNPAQDRRTLYVQDGAPGELHIFSGKVVSCVKAARLVTEKIESAPDA
jgi:hypothetical protein